MTDRPHKAEGAAIATVERVRAPLSRGIDGVIRGRIEAESETAQVGIEWDEWAGRVDFEVITGCAIINFSISEPALEDLAADLAELTKIARQGARDTAVDGPAREFERGRGEP